jgi:hypothetical protein
MGSSSFVSENWWDAGGVFLLARTQTYPPPDVKTGRGTLHSQYTLPPLGVRPCHARCEFGSLLWGELKLYLT